MFELLDYSFVNPADNLALEEQLLSPMLKTPFERPLLRIWENSQYCIVLGRGEKAENQIHIGRAKELNIPIIRRTSGGGTVVHGPGNINISFFLPYEYDDALKNIRKSYDFILAWVTQALFNSCGASTHMKGSSDLSFGEQKISGTAQCRKRHGMLHHMTLLVDFDLQIIPELLKEPDKRPDYRGEREHRQFVTTLHNEGFQLQRSTFKMELIKLLSAEIITLDDEIISATQQLSRKKYQQEAWNILGAEPEFRSP